MSDDVKEISFQISSLNQTIEGKSIISNQEKRKFHAETDKIKQYILETGNEVLKTQYLDKIQNLETKLKISCVKQKRTLVYMLDEILRFCAVWACLVTSTFVLVFPCIIITPFESIIFNVMGWNKKYQSANYCKILISNAVLLVAGITTDISYETSYEETFAKSSIVCFSHGSTIDAFLVSSAIKVKNYTLTKDDLFLIPFFNLMLVTFSAIPIVRSNLEKAKKSLQYVAETLGENECISIAPEGTRSKTGLLLDFKKGPFYIWEHLKVPIIPMVIIGAYELFPPGHQMCVSGKVYVKFLKPIQYTEAKNRDNMSRLLRQRMLQAIENSPIDASAPPTLLQRLKSLLAIFTLFLFDYVMICFIQNQATTKYGISLKSLLYYFSLFIVLSIPSIYVYAVYLMPAISSYQSKDKKKSD